MARKSLRRLAVTLAAASAIIGGGAPTYNTDDVVPTLPDNNKYGRGHYRNNWEQKRRANNLKLRKRRKKNKAAKKARRKNR